MKSLLKILIILLSVIVTLLELAEFLFLPALFVLIGALNHFPWPYYAITVGGYFALMLIAELILRWVFHALNKKYSSRFSKKLEKIIARFFANRKDSTSLSPENNT